MVFYLPIGVENRRSAAQNCDELTSIPARIFRAANFGSVGFLYLGAFDQWRAPDGKIIHPAQCHGAATGPSSASRLATRAITSSARATRDHASQSSHTRADSTTFGPLFRLGIETWENVDIREEIWEEIGKKKTFEKEKDWKKHFVKFEELEDFQIFRKLNHKKSIKIMKIEAIFKLFD